MDIVVLLAVLLAGYALGAKRVHHQIERVPVPDGDSYLNGFEAGFNARTQGYVIERRKNHIVATRFFGGSPVVIKVYNDGSVRYIAGEKVAVPHPEVEIYH